MTLTQADISTAARDREDDLQVAERLVDMIDKLNKEHPIYATVVEAIAAVTKRIKAREEALGS